MGHAAIALEIKAFGRVANLAMTRGGRSAGSLVFVVFLLLTDAITGYLYGDVAHQSSAHCAVPAGLSVTTRNDLITRGSNLFPRCSFLQTAMFPRRDCSADSLCFNPVIATFTDSLP